MPMLTHQHRRRVCVVEGVGLTAILKDDAEVAGKQERLVEGGGGLVETLCIEGVQQRPGICA